MTHKVFVYGTLRQGFRNHWHLDWPGVQCLGMARTQDPFILALLMGDVPALYRENPEGSSGTSVLGEVYQVPTTVLLQLDQLERHPNWYCREEAPVFLGGQDSPFMAWCYFMPGQPRPGQPVIPTGDYADAARLFR
jgi:gamma-glutamylaminecyclotransferase